MTNAVNIRVLFFGAARDAVAANQLDLALEAPGDHLEERETTASRIREA